MESGEGFVDGLVDGEEVATFDRVKVGANVYDVEGNSDPTLVGSFEGTQLLLTGSKVVGFTVGKKVGEAVGFPLGVTKEGNLEVGRNDVGTIVIFTVGVTEGNVEGRKVGLVGEVDDGAYVLRGEGAADGSGEGSEVCSTVGSSLGATVVGDSDGIDEGATVGPSVGHDRG